MTAAESIALGVISGILTSLFLFLFSQFAIKVAIPWYQQLIYKGIDVSGDWKAEVHNPTGNMQSMKAELTQRGTSLAGIITISKVIKDSGTTEIKTYIVTGTIRDRFVSVVAENTSRKNLGTHIELLEIVGSGESMQGKRTWYSATLKTICCEEILWQR